MMENRQSSCTNQYRANATVNGTNRTVTVSVTSGQRPSRKELMDRINQYSFAVNEATLFLDTHPYDTEALAYFQKYRELRMDAVKEYSKYYAPLVLDRAVNGQTPWSWVNEPWPWEGVEC